MPKLTPEARKHVGTLVHDCGQTAQVYQSKRTHLYIICPLCGCDQTNTPQVQTAWFRSLNRPEEAGPMVRPRNVLPDGAPIGQGAPTAPTEEPKTAPDPEPAAIPIGAATETGDGAQPESADTRPSLAPQGPDGAGTVTAPTVNAPIGDDAAGQKKQGGAGLFWAAVLGIGVGVSMIVSAMTAGAAGGRA